MSDSTTSCNTNEKRCEYYGSNKTYIVVTRNGTPYPKWNRNPLKEDSWICGKCYRNLLYHEALPLDYNRSGKRMKRIAEQIYFQYKNGKTAENRKTFNT